MGRQDISGLSRPNIFVDPGSAVRNSGRQVAWDAWPGSFRASPGSTVTTDGISAIGAVAVTVDPVPTDIPSGARFTLADGTKTFKTTAAVAAGAVSIPVEPLAEATADAESYTSEGSGNRSIPHATPVSEDVDGKLIPVDEGVDTAIGLLEGPAVEVGSTETSNQALTGYGVIVGGAVYRNLVPGLTAAIEAELKTNGYAWVFEDYEDDRAS